jgi:hypothetical protein
VPLPAALHGAGPGKRWQQWTPAMAAGLTDHVWSLRAVWRYRVPPWPQPQVGEGWGDSDARAPEGEKRVYSRLERAE